MSNRFGGVEAPEHEVVTGEKFGFEGDLDLSIDFYDEAPVSDHLAHISKSRIKTFLKCERKFAYKYLAEERADQNFYMERGSRVHDAFEEFHQNLEAFITANDEEPNSLTDLLGHASDWFQFLEYIGPFFEWELSRWEEAKSNAETKSEALSIWTPHSVEKSLEINQPPVGDLPWLGPYDALLDVQSVPQFDADEGYVVVDYKTGSLPKPQWRDKGIHIDLEFYSWMLECAGYHVVGAIGFYPTEDGNVVRSMPNKKIREDIADVVRHLHTVSATRSDFPIQPQPLCDYCFYEEQCPTTWDS